MYSSINYQLGALPVDQLYNKFTVSFILKNFHHRTIIYSINEMMIYYSYLTKTQWDKNIKSIRCAISLSNDISDINIAKRSKKPMVLNATDVQRCADANQCLNRYFSFLHSILTTVHNAYCCYQITSYQASSLICRWWLTYTWNSS